MIEIEDIAKPKMRDLPAWTICDGRNGGENESDLHSCTCFVSCPIFEANGEKQCPSFHHDEKIRQPSGSPSPPSQYASVLVDPCATKPG